MHRELKESFNENELAYKDLEMAMSLAKAKYHKEMLTGIKSYQDRFNEEQKLTKLLKEEIEELKKNLKTLDSKFT